MSHRYGRWRFDAGNICRTAAGKGTTDGGRTFDVEEVAEGDTEQMVQRQKTQGPDYISLLQHRPGHSDHHCCTQYWHCTAVDAHSECNQGHRSFLRWCGNNRRQLRNH